MDSRPVAKQLKYDVQVSSVAFSPAGLAGAQVLAVALYQGSVLRLDAKTLEELAPYEGMTGIEALVFACDGSLVAAGTDVVHFDGLPMAVPRLGLARTVDVSRNGECIVAGGEGCEVVVIHRARREVLYRRPRGDTVRAVRFSPLGGLLAVGAFDRTLAVLDAAKGTELWKIDTGFQVKVLCFTADGMAMLVGGTRRTVSIYGVASGEVVAEAVVAGNVNCVAPILRGSYFVLGTTDNRAFLVQGSAGSAEEIPTNPTGQIKTIACAAEGGAIVLGRTNGVLEVLDLTPGPVALRIAQSAVRMQLAMAGSLLAVAEDKSAAVVDLATGQEVLTVPCPAPVHGVSLSSDGAWLAHTANQHVRLVDIASREVLKDYDVGVTTYCVALAPDKTRLAATGRTTMVCYSLATDAVLFRLDASYKSMLCLAYSPDGSLVLAGGTGRCAVLVNQKGVVVHSLAMAGSVMSVAWTADSQRFAAAGDDAFVAIADREARMLHRIRRDGQVRPGWRMPHSRPSRAAP